MIQDHVPELVSALPARECYSCIATPSGTCKRSVATPLEDRSGLIGGIPERGTSCLSFLSTYPVAVIESISSWLDLTGEMAAAVRSSVLLLAAVILGFSGYGAMGADDLSDLDFMTELEQRKQFVSDGDFIFKFQKTSDTTPFGNLRPMFVDFNPALATLPGDGASQNLVTVGPCAINQPHNHPRATEISHVTEGELLFGFAEENGGSSFVGGNVTKGQTVIVPQGVIHFAQNLGCKEAQFIASFPHRDPGTQTTALTFFKLPIGAVRATTGLTDAEIKKILASVESNPNPSLDKVCAKRCGIKY